MIFDDRLKSVLGGRIRAFQRSAAPRERREKSKRFGARFDQRHEDMPGALDRGDAGAVSRRLLSP